MEYLNTVGAANLVIGVVLPFVVSLVTAKVASGRVKAFVLLVLSLLSASVVTAVADSSFAWDEVLNDAIVIWPTAILTHYGFWKPTNVTGSEGVINAVAPGGLGGGAAEEVVEDAAYEEVAVDPNAIAEQDLYAQVEANEGTGV